MKKHHMYPRKTACEPTILLPQNHSATLQYSIEWTNKSCLGL